MVCFGTERIYAHCIVDGTDVQVRKLFSRKLMMVVATDSITALPVSNPCKNTKIIHKTAVQLIIAKNSENIQSINNHIKINGCFSRKNDVAMMSITHLPISEFASSVSDPKLTSIVDIRP